MIDSSTRLSAFNMPLCLNLIDRQQNSRRRTVAPCWIQHSPQYVNRYYASAWSAMPPMDPIPRLSAPHALMRHMIDTPDFDTAAAAARIRKNAPEPLQEHWADIDGVLCPPKQAYHLISGQPRSEFNTHHALTQLRKCGFATSVYVPRDASDTEPAGDGPADSVETMELDP